jgi:hypothetical protein
VSPNGDNPIALKWSARFLSGIGAAAALYCVYSAIGTVRFIAESTRAEGTVVDWTQGEGRAPSSEPGAYFRIIEIETTDGQRKRGQAEVGVEMRRLEIGERVVVRYRTSDPTRMRVVSLSDLWVVELVTGVMAIAFGLGGWSLMAQARKSASAAAP